MSENMLEQGVKFVKISRNFWTKIPEIIQYFRAFGCSASDRTSNSLEGPEASPTKLGPCRIHLAQRRRAASLNSGSLSFIKPCAVQSEAGYWPGFHPALPYSSHRACSLKSPSPSTPTSQSSRLRPMLSSATSTLSAPSWTTSIMSHPQTPPNFLSSESSPNSRTTFWKLRKNCPAMPSSSPSC